MRGAIFSSDRGHQGISPDKKEPCGGTLFGEPQGPFLTLTAKRTEKRIVNRSLISQKVDDFPGVLHHRIKLHGAKRGQSAQKCNVQYFNKLIRRNDGLERGKKREKPAQDQVRSMIASKFSPFARERGPSGR